MKNTHIVLPAAFIAACSAISHASVTYFSTEASFLASITGPSVTEGYESYTPNEVIGAATFNLDHFDISYDGVSDVGVSDVIDLANGVVPIEGDQHFRVNYGAGVITTTRFTLDQPADAFGTYITDIDAVSIAMRIRLTDGTFVTPGGLSPHGNGGISFFGANFEGTNTQIEWFEFTVNAFSGLDGVFFDNTTITIPTPGAATLLGLATLGFVRRKR